MAISFYGFSIDLENVFCHNLLSKTFTKVNEFTSKLEHFSKNSPRVCERVNTYSGLVYLPRTLTCCMYYTTFILTQCSKPGLQTKTSTLAKIYSIDGFPMEIKTKIRYLIICGYHIFTL